MAVAVIADRVPRLSHRPRHLRQPVHIGADLEKRRRHLVPRQDLENLSGAFARPVVEGERHRPSRRFPAPDGRPKHRRRSPPHGPAHEAHRPTAANPRNAARNQGIHSSTDMPSMLPGVGGTPRWACGARTHTCRIPTRRDAWRVPRNPAIPEASPRVATPHARVPAPRLRPAGLTGTAF